MTFEPTEDSAIPPRSRAYKLLAPLLGGGLVVVLLGAVLPPLSAGGLPPEDRVPGADTTANPLKGAAPLAHGRDPGLELRRRAVTETFDPARAPFQVLANGTPLLYSVQAIQVLPGESVEIRVDSGASVQVLGSGSGSAGSGPGASGNEVPAAGANRYALNFREGEAASDADRWRWVAPTAPGAYPLEVRRLPDGQVVSLNVLVAHPRKAVRNGALFGYRMGSYQEKPLRGNPRYLPPEGFVEVPPEYADVAVSPHFTLEQFLCKQEGDRKFIVYSPDLVTKLEAGLERLNDQGFDVPTFHVMSGFRTPAYNRAIGNTTIYSRHLYGDAADVFVDVDGNGYMDDLTGDGRTDAADARLLMGVFEDLASAHLEEVIPGGLGLYGPAPHRGPFVHVDTRGNRARW